MTILTRPDIIQQMKEGRILISAFLDEPSANTGGGWINAFPEELHIGPNSIDLHLHRD